MLARYSPCEQTSLSQQLQVSQAQLCIQGFEGALHTATLNNEMSGEHNSSHCLRLGQCDPLGGHSVWAAMPPFSFGRTGKKGDNLPTTLVVAQMDGVGLFHDLIWVIASRHTPIFSLQIIATIEA